MATEYKIPPPYTNELKITIITARLRSTLLNAINLFARCCYGDALFTRTTYAVFECLNLDENSWNCTHITPRKIKFL